jgi:hypothetical protein
MRAAVTLSLLLLSAPSSAGPMVIVDRQLLQQRMVLYQSQLLQAQPRVTDPAAAAMLGQVARELGDMARVLFQAPLASPALDGQMVAPPPPPPPPPALMPMDPGAFASLVAAVDAESFSANKLRVLQEAAARNNFSVAQLVRLVNALSFAKDKVHAVEIVGPRLVDPQNAFQVYDAFTFAADKRRVQQILGR